MSLARWAHRLIARNRRSRKTISTILTNLTMFIIIVPNSRLPVWDLSSYRAYQGAGYWFSINRIANEEGLSVEGAYFWTQNPPNHFS